jgi:hypothetical protein
VFTGLSLPLFRENCQENAEDKKMDQKGMQETEE